jgi:hypothetical protein
MYHRIAWFSTEIFAGALSSVVQYLALLQQVNLVMIAMQLLKCSHVAARVAIHSLVASQGTGVAKVLYTVMAMS